jgi:hypothetical protein
VKLPTHLCMVTREATAAMRWTVLHHSPCSPDLATSDSHLFGPRKDALRGRRFAEDDELKHIIGEGLRCFSKGFYATGIQRLTQRWKSVLIMNETLWKNDLNFVKDVSMRYVNVIVIAIIVYEKRSILSNEDIIRTVNHNTVLYSCSYIFKHFGRKASIRYQ